MRNPKGGKKRMMFFQFSLGPPSDHFMEKTGFLKLSLGAPEVDLGKKWISLSFRWGAPQGSLEKTQGIPIKPKIPRGPPQGSHMNGNNSISSNLRWVLPKGGIRKTI